MKLSLSAKVLSTVTVFLAAEAALLALVLAAFAVRDGYISRLAASERNALAVQSSLIQSRRALEAQFSSDDERRRVERERLQRRFKTVAAAARFLPGAAPASDRVVMLSQRAIDWVAAGRGQLADRVYAAQVRRIIRAKLKSAGDQWTLSETATRRLLLERAEALTALIVRLTWTLAATTGFLILVAAWWGTNCLVERLGRLGTALELAGEGQLRLTLPAAERDELGKLAEGFNQMVRLLDKDRARRAWTEKSAGMKRLAQGAAHELNNPLSAIIGYADLLLGEDLDEPVKEDLRNIRRQAERCDRAIQRLISLDSGRAAGYPGARYP